MQFKNGGYVHRDMKLCYRQTAKSDSYRKCECIQKIDDSLQSVIMKMKQESEEERNKSYQATSRVLAVETGKRGRPFKITPGDCGDCEGVLA